MGVNTIPGAGVVSDPSVYADPTAVVIPYCPGIVKTTLGLFMFGGASLMLTNASLTNTQGLILEHFIHLGPEGANIFYAMLALASGAMVMYCLFYAVPALLSPRHIVLRRDGITLPKLGIANQHMNFARKDIKGFTVTVCRGYRFLKIQTISGTFTVNPTWLSDPGELDRIMQWLQGR